VFLAFAVGIIVWTYASQRAARPGATSSVSSSSNTAAANGPSSANSDTASTQPSAGTSAAGEGKPGSKDSAKTGPESKKSDVPFDYGRTTPVKGDANAQVRSVAEALRDKDHPERLSALLPIKPFDPKSYKEDAKAYLNTIEPGRCFQSAQPGNDVPQLRPLSPQFQNVAQGQSVTLRVQVAPKAPCSFTSFDLGKFQNELTAITVEADEKGVAETKFFGTPGTINEVNIVAASPTSSGQARFMVNVTK